MYEKSLYFKLGLWSEWSNCMSDKLCGTGTRKRYCIGPQKCVGVSIEECEYDSVCKLTSFATKAMSCHELCSEKSKNSYSWIFYE